MIDALWCLKVDPGPTGEIRTAFTSVLDLVTRCASAQFPILWNLGRTIMCSYFYRHRALATSAEYDTRSMKDFMDALASFVTKLDRDSADDTPATNEDVTAVIGDYRAAVGKVVADLVRDSLLALTVTKGECSVFLTVSSKWVRWTAAHSDGLFGWC